MNISVILPAAGLGRRFAVGDIKERLTELVDQTPDPVRRVELVCHQDAVSREEDGAGRDVITGATRDAQQGGDGGANVGAAQSVVRSRLC